MISHIPSSTNRILLEAEGSGGGGNPQPDPQPQADVSTTVKKAVADALARHGNDTTAALTTLIKQVHVLEQRAVAAEGNVMSEADKADLLAFRGLGKPDELKQQIEAGQTAISERDALKRDETFAQAATIAGYNPDVFKDLARDKQLAVSVREGKAFVTVKDGDKDVERPLGEHVQSALVGYLPALQPTQQQTGGRRFIEQRGGQGAAPAVDIVQQRLDAKAADRQARPNALMQPAPVVPVQQPITNPVGAPPKR